MAQLILEKIEYADVELVDDIDETERGAGGFGSTGVEKPLKRVRSSGASLGAAGKEQSPITFIVLTS